MIAKVVIFFQFDKKNTEIIAFLLEIVGKQRKKGEAIGQKNKCSRGYVDT